MGHLITLLSNIMRFLNILGTDGSCESLTPFTAGGVGTSALSATWFNSGTQSIKFTAIANNAYRWKDYTYTLDTTKQYVAACWVYIESYTSGTIDLNIFDVGTFTAKYTASAVTTTIGVRQLVYVKIPTSNTLVGTGFRLLFGASSVGTNVSYFDDVRIYEVSSALYTAIGTIYTTNAEIDNIIPYVGTM